MVKLMPFRYVLFAPLLMLGTYLLAPQACAQSEARQVTIIAGGQVRQPTVKTNKTAPNLPKLRPLKSLELDMFDPVPELLGGPERSGRARRSVVRAVKKQRFKPSVLKVPPAQSISD